MQGHEAPSGVPGDTSRDGAEPSRVVVEAFFGKRRMVPGVYGGVLMTPVQVFFSGEQMFSVAFGEIGAEFTVWTDVRGIDAIIESCMAAKVRAEVSGAELRPVVPSLAAALDLNEVPW